MPRLPPKDYQTETLEVLADYCREVRRRDALGEGRAEQESFHAKTGREYYTAPGFAGIPYVCLRLPTGGGKTLLAAKAIGGIGRALLGTDRPVCLWITPSTTIRDQTLRALQRETHPYYLELKDSLACDVQVTTLEEALTKPSLVRSKETALVLVTTIQSYRLRDKPGAEEFADTRRIYRDNGYLQEAFQNLPPEIRAGLACDENGLVNLSLANALRLRRPIVIIDEAHNARTPTSFESLARFGPKFVLELTATPEHRHDPQHPTDPRFASNVLYAVSALELKNEGMIKLPVDLENRRDWLDVLAATVNRRDELETIADRASREGEETIPFYRPIALVQAQKDLKNKDCHTVEKVKAALTVKQDGRWTLFEPEELDKFAWELDQCNPELSEAEFPKEFKVGTAATIDVEANPGRRDARTVMEITGDVRLIQLELIGEGDDWTAVELTRWLDRELHRGDSLLGLPLKESQPWLHKTVEELVQKRGISLPVVVRRRHALAELLRTKVADHGRAQVRRATEWLIRNEPDAIETSDEFAIKIEEEDYRPSSCYEGALRLQKHAFDLIFQMNGEEEECAATINSHPNVLRWIRNTERETQGGFWLPKSPGKYFPDFIVELTNGVIVLVEYKMGKMANDPDERHKRAIGELWEARSDGRTRFAWVVDRNWQVLAEKLA